MEQLTNLSLILALCGGAIGILAILLGLAFGIYSFVTSSVDYYKRRRDSELFFRIQCECLELERWCADESNVPAAARRILETARNWHKGSWSDGYRMLDINDFRRGLIKCKKPGKMGGLLDMAENAFGSSSKAFEWWNRPLETLDGRTPYAYVVETDDTKRIKSLLETIEHVTKKNGD